MNKRSEVRRNVRGIRKCCHPERCEQSECLPR